MAFCLGGLFQISTGKENPRREKQSLWVEFRDAHVGSRCGRGGRGRRNRHISNNKWPELFQM